MWPSCQRNSVVRRNIRVRNSQRTTLAHWLIRIGKSRYDCTQRAKVAPLIVSLVGGAPDSPDVHAHLRGIEAALAAALRRLDVPPRAIPGLTGVFVDDPAPGLPRKIASIGVGVRHWVTWHGFALNVDLDLSAFDPIVPCGLHGVAMTSLARELGPAAPSDLPARAQSAVAEAFAARF